MVVDYVSVGCLDSFAAVQPALHFLENHLSLYIKMPMHDVFESLRRIFNHVEHGELDIAIFDDIAVSLVLFLTGWCTLFSLKSRLIKVDILTHNN